MVDEVTIMLYGNYSTFKEYFFFLTHTCSLLQIILQPHKQFHLGNEGHSTGAEMITWEGRLINSHKLCIMKELACSLLVQ